MNLSSSCSIQPSTLKYLKIVSPELKSRFKAWRKCSDKVSSKGSGVFLGKPKDSGREDWGILGNIREDLGNHHPRPLRILSGWWLNHPSEKYARQNGFIFPNFRGENKKSLKPPVIANAPCWCCVHSFRFSACLFCKDTSTQGLGVVAHHAHVAPNITLPPGGWFIHRSPSVKLKLFLRKRSQ